MNSYENFSLLTEKHCLQESRQRILHSGKGTMSLKIVYKFSLPKRSSSGRSYSAPDDPTKRSPCFKTRFISNLENSSSSLSDVSSTLSFSTGSAARAIRHKGKIFMITVIVIITLVKRRLQWNGKNWQTSSHTRTRKLHCVLKND